MRANRETGVDNKEFTASAQAVRDVRGRCATRHARGRRKDFRQIRRYLGTTLATIILTGVASSLWSWMTGLELVLVWGILNFLLNFVPVIGNIVGIVPPVLFAFIQFGGWQMPLLVFAGFVVLQMTISNVVYPILQGKQLSLSPLAIIVAMTFWSWVWGIAGALIAVPLTAAIVMICAQFDRSRWIAKLLSS
jgi:AI-2 transport protein TqsA